MEVAEYSLLVGLIGLGLIATISDLKTGLIRNRIIIRFAILAIILDIVYYGLFLRDSIILFLINVGITTVLSIYLFFSHSFAGGDCKLIIVMSALYPVGMYLSYGKSNITLFFVIGFSILYGYIYLMVVSLWKLLVGDTKINSTYIKAFLKMYLKTYCIAFIYITSANLLFVLVGRYGFVVPDWIMLIISMAVAWACGKYDLLKNKSILIAAIMVDIILCLYVRIKPISLNPRSYILMLILILCQMTIRTNIYDEIPTSNIREGMVLSTVSSIAMQASRIKGLPDVSREDLRDRLTVEQVESIKKWGKSTKGQETVTIVKKIPFAIFIFMGFVTYYIIWRLL